MPKPKRDAEWSYLFAVAEKLFHRDGIPKICRANFCNLLDGYREVNATGAELQRRHAEAVTAWGAEWVTMVRLLKDWSMFAPKTTAGRPHFTQGQATAIWMILKSKFSMGRSGYTSQSQWDSFVTTATRNTPLIRDEILDKEVWFDEFDITFMPREFRVKVKSRRFVDKLVAIEAQAEIDALLETWGNDDG